MNTQHVLTVWTGAIVSVGPIQAIKIDIPVV